MFDDLSDIDANFPHYVNKTVTFSITFLYVCTIVSLYCFVAECSAHRGPMISTQYFLLYQLLKLNIIQFSMLYFHDSYAITYRNFRPIIVAIISFLFLQFYDLIRYRQFSYKVYIRNNTCIYKFINNKKFSPRKKYFLRERGTRLSRNLQQISLYKAYQHRFHVVGSACGRESRYFGSQVGLARSKTISETRSSKQ